MRFGFMSSVAPGWTLDQVIAAAGEYGFDAVELRVEWGHAAAVELDATAAQRREARRKLADAGLAVSGLALGARLAQPSAEERAATVEQIARYAALAADLGAPVLRVFGGPVPEGHSVAGLRDAAAETLGRAAARAAEYGVAPCLETHDHFNDPADVAHVVAGAGHPNVGVVWHANHHLRLGIPVADAYRTLRPWVRHCHIGEGARPGEERPADRPIPLGEGDGQVREIMRLLHADGYDGVLSWEWINGKQTAYNVPDVGGAVDPRPHLAQYGAKLREYAAELD